MGLVEITFSEPLMKIPDGLDISKLTYTPKRRNLQSEPVFTVSVEPSALQDPEKIQMSWEFIEITQTKILI